VGEECYTYVNKCPVQISASEFQQISS